MSDDSITQGHDPAYLTRRRDQASAAAAASQDPSARVAHQAMANRYAEELRAIGATPLA